MIGWIAGFLVLIGLSLPAVVTAAEYQLAGLDSLIVIVEVLDEEAVQAA